MFRQMYIVEFHLLKLMVYIDTHPNFCTIDYLRQVSDPIVSYWRFFECGEELKTFKRFCKLQKYYPLPHNDSALVGFDEKTNLNDIFHFLLNKKTIIVIGFYVYNYYCHLTKYEPINIPYYEFISIDYKKDALDLIELLKAKLPNITYE